MRRWAEIVMSVWVFVVCAVMSISSLQEARMPWHDVLHAQPVDAFVVRIVSMERLDTYRGARIKESVVVPLVNYELADGKTYECSYIDHEPTREEFDALQEGVRVPMVVDAHFPERCHPPALSKQKDMLMYALLKAVLLGVGALLAVVFLIKRARAVREEH